MVHEHHGRVCDDLSTRISAGFAITVLVGTEYDTIMAVIDVILALNLSKNFVEGIMDPDEDRTRVVAAYYAELSAPEDYEAANNHADRLFELGYKHMVVECTRPPCDAVPHNIIIKF
jgi:hypothetical protein